MVLVDSPTLRLQASIIEDAAKIEAYDSCWLVLRRSTGGVLWRCTKGLTRPRPTRGTRIYGTICSLISRQVGSCRSLGPHATRLRLTGVRLRSTGMLPSDSPGNCG